MTTAALVSDGSSLRRSPLRRWHLILAAAAAVGLTAVLFAVTPLQGQADFVILAAVLAVAAVVAVSWRVEGARRAKARLVGTGAVGALVLTLLPLGMVLGYTVTKGLKRFGPSFLTHSMGNIGPLDAGGGVYHAIIGTLEQVLIATAIAVPLGLLVAIYITEYGNGKPLASVIRFFVDVMTGIPSIVVGLFVLAFWVLTLHQGFSGLAGGISLAIIELPVIVRSAEEMIKLVPSGLREASYALGIPKWRTILHVVLPTAASGITTGVMLAVARVTGETAPVLLVVGTNLFINANPFKGQQGSLPLFVFTEARKSVQVAIDRAWAGAMTLVIIVAVLYIAARLLTRRNALARR